MRFIAVLNRDGGTLRTTNLDAFCERMTATLEKAGHRVDVERVSGGDIEAALAKAAASRADVLLAGGGDGTASAAAGMLMGKKKALAILPAGTMNLVARGLGIPLSLDGAVQAFAEGEVVPIDVASANGHPFIHQISLGMHAKMVGLRDKMTFASRLGKMSASMRASLATLLDPPSLRVLLQIGDAEIITRATAISITNNLFGEGHLPYADQPDGGVLGVYVTVARERGQLLRFFLNAARGRWRDNPHVEIHEGEKVVLKLLSRSGKRKCVIDGELLPLARETTVEIHKKVLNVLVPAKPERIQAQPAAVHSMV
jgi:diacylglycerol kinase family enzyme